MIRKLLATTALVSIMAGGAFAAEHQKAEGQMNAQGQMDRFITTADDAAMASTIIGESVYTSSAEDAESVGEINDLLVGSDGEIDAAIIGVGGFLGLGEKNVAVSYDNLKLTTDEDGTYYVVLETTKEELEAAPEFDVRVVTERQTPREGKAHDQMAAADKPADNTATTDKPMPADQMAAVDRRTTAEQPAMDRDRIGSGRQDYAIVDVSTMGTDELIGANVYSYDNDRLGEIGEVILNDDGKTDAIIIDVGGFLGIGEKPVAVAFEDLEFRADEGGNLYVYTQFTEDQLEAATEYDEEEYKQRRDQMRVRTAG